MRNWIIFINNAIEPEHDLADDLIQDKQKFTNLTDFKICQLDDW